MLSLELRESGRVTDSKKRLPTFNPVIWAYVILELRRMMRLCNGDVAFLGYTKPRPGYVITGHSSASLCSRERSSDHGNGRDFDVAVCEEDVLRCVGQVNCASSRATSDNGKQMPTAGTAITIEEG